MPDPKPLPDHVLSITIRAPIERVWHEITKTGEVQKAVYNTVLETSLRAGDRLRYYSPDRSRVFVVGEVVECRPPLRFSHTYWFTTWRTGTPTLVTWELAQRGDETIVTITHSGWTEAHKEYRSTRSGWNEILALLKAVVERGRLPLRARLTFAVMNRLLFLLPRRTRAAHIDAQDW
jgi:uncharacterized protein YndB with AHSA1/START domain